MAFRILRVLLRHFFSLFGLLLLIGTGSTTVLGQDSPPDPIISSIKPQTQTTGTFRVNSPYFKGDVVSSQSAVFWFGRVTPTENSADVRIGHNDDHLSVRVATVDRRLWYDSSPGTDDLANWDAITLYLDLDGNVGDIPDSNSYQFDAQLVWWEPRGDHQAAFQGNGSSWVTATVPFTTTSWWRGNAPNDDEDDRGWVLNFFIPYQSLGTDGPPAHGTVWGMALALHDRDDGVGPPIVDTLWPPMIDSQSPATWGQLAFGLPIYEPPQAVPGGKVTIRHGLDGATVMDADVGGSFNCGDPVWPDYYSSWGEMNHAGTDLVNVQNQGDVADWTCFSKYYVTFPLDSLPADTIIISATLTMHQWGNAGQGYDPGPEPSLIQALTISDDWDESTVTWNNAPMAKENISATWVEPHDSPPDWPGVPWQWDVSQAASEAYASGIPLRLALYEADWDYHSGKYFHSSDTAEWNQVGRPTLTIAFGNAASGIQKTAAQTSGRHSDPITYTLSFLGTGQTLTLTDTLPAGVSAPGSFELVGTSITPTYDDGQQCLTWSDTPSSGQEVIIRYAVSITTKECQTLTNTVALREIGGESNAACATISVNPYLIHLPTVIR